MHKILLPTEENIEYAAQALKHGELVVFPTETVYGLGGNAYNEVAVSRIFSYKDRPVSKSLSVCYGSFKEALTDGEADDQALRLAKAFMPGPITIIVKRNPGSRLSPLCSSAGTIGIRVPANAVALNLLSRLPFPLAAPSANKSAHQSPTTAQQVSNDLSDIKDLIILDGGTCSIGVASTIVDVSSGRIHRVGSISLEDIRNVVSEF